MTRAIEIALLLIGKRSIVRYGAIGATAASLDFVLFTVLINVFSVQLSSVLGVAAGIVTSYILNSKLNFFQDLAKKRAIRFLVVGVSGMTVSTVLITLMVSFSIEPVMAKLLTIPMVALSQYLLNSYWTFRQS